MVNVSIVDEADPFSGYFEALTCVCCTGITVYGKEQHSSSKSKLKLSS